MNISKFFQATPNVMIFRYAPTWLSTRYLRFLGVLYYIINRQERYLIEQNIMTVFRENSEARSIVKKAFDGIFFHYAEKLIMAHRRYDNVKKELWDAMEYSGIGFLDMALKKGGVILVTAHFGAVEFLPLALALRGYPVTMVVKFQTERLKKSLMQRADEVNVELIDCREGRVMQRAMNSLKRGRILLTECDEVDAWKTRADQTIDAFKSRIFMDRSLEVLCRRSGSTALGSFMIRTNRGIRLSIVPFGDEEKIEKEGLSALILKTFEQFVMMFPDQWYQWKKFHRMRTETV